MPILRTPSLVTMPPSVSSRASRSVTVRVPAKVNLQLSVGPRRDDGYHDLVTVFHAVDVCDQVVARPSDELMLSMRASGADLVPADASNLAWRAAVALAEHVGMEPEVSLEVTKEIPVAGGMAGGSADAAAALVACDALWNLGTPREELQEIAASLGSDVPFALYGGTAIGTGRGEVITPVLGRGDFHWVFAVASEGLSTPAVYARCDELREDAGEITSDPYVSDLMLQALRAGDAELLGKALSNDLQPAALSLRPSLSQVLEVGEEYGALGQIVSGSGPTCAFLVRDPQQGANIAMALMATGHVRTVKQSRGPVTGARVIN